MTVWEIVIMMVVGTFCVTAGIGIVYSSLVNTVERYQIRKKNRELEMFIKIVERIPELFSNLTNIIEEKDKKENEEFKRRIRELAKTDE